MKEIFRRNYEKKTESELLRIVGDEKTYELDAREIALEILEKRQGNSDQIQSKKEEIQNEKAKKLVKLKAEFGAGNTAYLDADGPHLYSETVVLVSTVLISSIAGGVLMYLNFLELRKPREANLALGFGIMLFILGILLGFHLPTDFSAFPYFLNLIGLAVYAQYFWKIHIGSDTAYYRKPWLLTVLGILLGIIVFAFGIGVLSLFL